MLKLFRFLQNFRGAIVLVLVLVFLQSLSELYLPTLMSDIVDKGITKGDISYIWKIGGFMLLVSAAGAVFSVMSSYYSSTVAAAFGKLVRGKVFAHVENFSLHAFDQFGTASLITRTTNDITQVQQVLVMIMRMMIMAPMMCIGGIIMAVSKDAKLSLVLVVALPLLAGAIFGIASKGIPLFKVMQTKLDKLNLVLREALIGIRVIRAFNRIDHEKSRFHEANRDLTDTAIKVNKIMAAMMPTMIVVLNFSSIAIIWFGGIRIADGNMQVGDLMAFLQYAMQIMFSLIMLSMMFVMLPRASASAVRINEVLNMPADIKDSVNGTLTEGKHGVVEFQNVTFNYPGAEKPALSDISFTAKPGKVTAIIGGTGSGKSTLISLIPRFYDTSSGRILIDGTNITEMTQESLRAQIGLVPQKTELFTGTIAENIRYGKENATDEEVKLAAEIAQAAEFIADIEEGLDYKIAQGGMNLSGGQKQRLSIARALVRKPLIYVFDDSFSALDFRTDAKLRSALQQVRTESTLIIVAQRVSTVIDADQIIVLDEGQIAGIGNHPELMETCEVYREIVFSQLSEEEIA
jgi:ATP-binding cassette subfamily B protein